MDIIKSGGYKISALDIERHLLTHDDITEVAVIGLPDHMFGQRIAAVLVLKEGSSLKEDDLKTWLKDKMPKYQVRNITTEINVLAMHVFLSTSCFLSFFRERSLPHLQLYSSFFGN